MDCVDPTEGIAPLDVDITCSGFGGNGDLIYKLTFGDGTPAIESSSPITRQHVYYTGDHTIQCEVTDEDGDSDNEEQVILVEQDLIPTARITAEPTEGISPLDVSL